MTILSTIANGDTGKNIRDTLNSLITKNAAMFLPAQGTGNDAAAIQAAHDAAVSAGGGVVWLSNLVWTITSTLELDCNYVAFQGLNAQLKFTGTRDVGIHFFSSDPSGVGSGVETLPMRGLHMTFASTINRGLYLYQANNPAQQNAAKSFEYCAIAGAQNTIEIADNSYIFTFRNCAIGASGTVCLFRGSSNNNSERVTFDGCTFYNSPRFLDIVGVSADFYFINCSFDYCSQHIARFTSGDYMFVACHFEAAPIYQPFELDNSAIAHFTDCFFGVTQANGVPMFTTYGGGAEVHLTDCFQGLTPPAGTPLCTDPIEVTVKNFSDGSTNQWKKVATTGTVVINALMSTVYHIAPMTGNITLAPPVNGTRNTEFCLYVDQAASGTGPFTMAYDASIKWEGGVAPVMPTTAGATLVIYMRYDAWRNIWYARSNRKIVSQDVNFGAAGTIYISADGITRVDAVGNKIGSGNLTYAKSTNATPETFGSAITLPTVLEAGARLKVTADAAAFQQLRVQS